MAKTLSMTELLALEWGRLRRERAFWAALALLTLSLWYGLAAGASVMQQQRETVRRAGIILGEGIAEAKAKAASLDPSSEIGLFEDPRSAMAFEAEYLKLHDCLPPAPLAMAAIGQSDLLPVCVRVTTGPWPIFLASYEWENPLRLLLGRFDCAFAITFIAPLLVLLVSFDLLARELELGTAALLFSSAVMPARWLAASFLLRAALFLGAFCAALLAGLSAAGLEFSAPGAMLRLSLFLAVSAAYLAFWFGLAFLVNAARKGPAANALTLAACWLALVVLLPSTLNLAVKAVYPLPSRVEFINALRHETEESTKRSSELLKSYREDHPGLGAEEELNNFVTTLLAVNAGTERALKPMKDRFRIQKDRQTAAISRFSLLSPAILFREAAAEAAGNDQFRHQAFMDAVEVHRGQVKNFFDPKFVSEAAFTGYDDVPPFHFEEAPLSQLVTGIAPVCLVLSASALAFVLAGIWLLGRRPILES